MTVEYDIDSTIWFESRNRMSGLDAVFDDDGRTAYLYLIDPEKNTILNDVWVYNRLSAPKAPYWKPSKKRRPLLNPTQYVIDPSPHGPVDKSQIEIVWSQEGKSVMLNVGGICYATLSADGSQGYSRFAKKDGPLARALRTELMNI